MARPIRHVPRDSTRRRVWVYLAIAVFVLADIALIIFALNPPGHTATAEAPRPASTVATPSAAAPTATPEPTAASAAVSIVAVPPTRFLAAVDAATAWRLVTGECPAIPAEPELTTDSGATWSPTDATGPTEVTAPQSLTATSESVMGFVGLSESDCAPEFVQTFVGGDNFKSYPDQLASAWFVDPGDRASVHSPVGDVAAPCDSVIALAPRDAESAAVLCADQTVFVTTDAAETWSSGIPVRGAINLTVAGTGYASAAVGLPECDGVQMIALAEEPLEVTRSGCLQLETPVAALPGNVALSEVDGTIWLWAGDVTKRSFDGGMAWQ